MGPNSLPQKRYKSLSSSNSWYELYTTRYEGELATFVSSTMDPKISKDPQMAYALKASTDQSTIPATILAALEAVYLSLSDRKTLDLHIIGVTARELHALRLFEDLLHFLPSLKDLHCTFIGPEVPSTTDFSRNKMECCPSCQRDNRIRSLSIFKGPYHKYTASNQYKKPDLAVAFHTGHSQEAKEEWNPTIQFLAKAEFPTVFTCFNEIEMQEEMAGLEKKGVSWVKRGELNKWRGMIASLEAAEIQENAVYSMNMFWYIIGSVTA